jgi:5-methylcytosine-specific restriction endonuclease McrA
MARSKIDNRRAYQRNPEKLKARVRAWADANKNKIAARMSSPMGRLKRRMHEGNRRARMQGRITPEQWLAVIAAWGDRCAYCGAGGPLQMDHFVPLARGGVHELHNVVPACERCNKSKCARDPWEFLRRAA